MSNDQETILIRHAYRDEALFFGRMIWIWNSDAKIISEHCGCLLKGHTMLSKVP